MTTIFAWFEVGPDGREGLIVAEMPLLNNQIGPLQHRKLDIVKNIFGPLAIQHGKVAGRTVRLIEYNRGEVLAEVEPD
jgi:hypothetical protein